MNCNCGLPSILQITQKNGPNHGKRFYSCKNRKCRFFIFEDDIPRSNSDNNSVSIPNFAQIRKDNGYESKREVVSLSPKHFVRQPVTPSPSIVEFIPSQLRNSPNDYDLKQKIDNLSLLMESQMSIITRVEDKIDSMVKNAVKQNEVYETLTLPEFNLRLQLNQLSVDVKQILSAITGQEMDQ